MKPSEPLTRRHDLSAFTDPESCRFDLDAIRYDATRRVLIATDRRLLMLVPFDGGELPSMDIPAKVLAALCSEDSLSICGQMGPVRLTPSEDGQVNAQSGGPALPVSGIRTDPLGNFPDVFEIEALQPEFCPDVIVNLSPALLLKIVNHALEMGCENLILAIRATPGQKTVDYDQVLFWFDTAPDDPSDAIAALMTRSRPDQIEEQLDAQVRKVVHDKSGLTTAEPA